MTTSSRSTQAAATAATSRPGPVPDAPHRRGAPARSASSTATSRVLMTLKHPRVIVLGGFLSRRGVRRDHRAGRPAHGALGDGRQPDRRQRGQRGAHQRRHVLRARRVPVCDRVEQRIAALLDWPLENGEGPAGAALPAGRRVQAALRLLRPGPAGLADHPQARRPARRHAAVYLNTPRRAAAPSSPTSAWRSRRSRATPSSSATTAPPSTTSACTAARR